MNVYEYFTHCEKLMPEKIVSLRRASSALCKERVNTMEKLCEMKQEHPKKLADLRNIGSHSLAIIDEVIGFYKGQEIEEKSHNI